MTTIDAGQPGTASFDTVRAPYRCTACGEPLYTRALACPHCGAPDPVSAVEAAAGAGAAAAADAPAAPAGIEAAAPPPAVDAPPVDAVPTSAEATPAAETVDYAELEPVEDMAPRMPRPPAGAASARLDIAPDPYDDEPDEARELVLVPERGGRDVMLPERRRGRLLGVGLALLVVIGVAAAGVLGWRMLAGPAAVASQELSIGTAWTGVDLDGGGEWVVTADAPFRIRVDGAVYTVTGPSGFAVPLAGRQVAVRAISGTAKVTLARR